MKIVADGYRSLFLALFATFMLYGISCTVVGAALPSILADFKWNYEIAGALMAAGSLGSFLAMFGAGRIIDRAGPRVVLALGFVLVAASLAFFGATRSPVLNIALYFVLGVGQAGLEVAVNWLALRMDDRGVGGPMNLMHGAFSIGAVVGPFVVGMLLSSHLSWTLIYRGAAAFFGLLLIVTFFLPLSRVARAGRKEGPAIRARPSAARYVGFVALFFYVGTELGISNWAAEYFVRSFAFSVAAASFIVSVFWAGLSAGRFGIPVFLRRARPDRILVLLSVLLAAAVVVLAALGGGGPVAAVFAVAAVALAGLGASCVYPSVITLVGKASPEAPGPAIGLASAGGSFGSFVFPFAMSGIATARGVHAGFVFYAVMGAASLASCWALARAISAKRSPVAKIELP
jgi:fucose permease